MSKLKYLPTFVLAFLLYWSPVAAEKAPPQIGVVDFEKCITESKRGQDEQNNFKKIEDDMKSLLTAKQKEIEELNTKLQDCDFIDGLSPAAKKDLEAKFHRCNEEYQLYQNQLMQVLQQANMKFLDVMVKHIKEAANTVAKKEKIPFIVQKNVCFSYPSKAEVTAEVVANMDKIFDQENDTKTAPKTLAEKGQAEEKLQAH